MRTPYHFLLIVPLLGKSAFGFSNSNIQNRRQSSLSSPALSNEILMLRQTELHAFTDEQQLAFWMTSFSTSHIGMSAIREKLIRGFGQLASKSNLVDRGVKLPSYWPGKFLSFYFIVKAYRYTHGLKEF